MKSYGKFDTKIPILQNGVYPKCRPSKTEVYLYIRPNGVLYYYDHHGKEHPVSSGGSSGSDIIITDGDGNKYLADDGVYKLIDYYVNPPIVPKQYIDPSLNFVSKATKFVVGAGSPLYTYLDLGTYQNLSTINAYDEGGERLYEHRFLIRNTTDNLKMLTYIRLLPPSGESFPPNPTLTTPVSPHTDIELVFRSYGGWVAGNVITV